MVNIKTADRPAARGWSKYDTISMASGPGSKDTMEFGHRYGLEKAFDLSGTWSERLLHDDKRHSFVSDHRIGIAWHSTA